MPLNSAYISLSEGHIINKDLITDILSVHMHASVHFSSYGMRGTIIMVIKYRNSPGTHVWIFWRYNLRDILIVLYLKGSNVLMQGILIVWAIRWERPAAQTVKWWGNRREGLHWMI